MNSARSEFDEDAPVAGAIYSVTSGDGGFGIAKVLVADDTGVHVCLYRNRFPSRPVSVNLGDLSVGSIFDSDGFGIGHLPLSYAEFSSWQPQYLVATDVAEEELEGYRYWKEDQGGVFGKEPN